MKRRLTRGFGKRGRQKGVSLICLDLFRKQIGRKRSKSEQIGVFPKTRNANRNKSEKKRGNWNKSKQVGVTPFCRPQIGGSDEPQDNQPIDQKKMLIFRGLEENTEFFVWLTGRVVPGSAGPLPEQKVYVYVPFSLPRIRRK